MISVKVISITALFTSFWVLYTSSPVVTSFDSRWSIPVCVSLIEEHNEELSEFPDLIEHHHGLDLHYIDQMPFSNFPVWSYMLSVPAVYVFDRALIPLIQNNPRIRAIASERISNTFHESKPIETVYLYIELEKILASAYCALTVVFVFLTALLFLSQPAALLTALLYGAGTSAWSTASRGMWMHGPSMMFLAVVVYMLASAPACRKQIKFIGIPLAVSFLIRPTNIVAVAFVTLYVFIQYRKEFLRFVLLALPIMAVFFLYNHSAYGTLLPAYFKPARLGTHSSFFEAMAGNLVSPARGIFVYSPFLLFSIHGFFLAFRDRSERLLATTFSLILVSHWITVSFFPHWWGGHCYGPRFMSDVLPLMFYFLLFSIRWILQQRGVRKIFLLALLCFLGILSAAIHFRGAWDFSVYRWSTSPINIDEHPERLWDWNDPQFLRHE